LAGKDEPETVLAWLDDNHCLLKEMGRGSTCVVYQARNRQGQSYALKVPLAGADSLLREARFLQALRSPHVVRCLGACTEGAAPYLKLELLRGETLAQRLARRGRLKLAALENAVDQILSGLEAVHALDVVHGDLKPSNLFLAKQGRYEQMKIMDFGLALREGERRLGGAQGTAVYAAPEQWGEGPLDRRADLYSLGVVIFEMATGLLPWSAEEPAALLAKKRQVVAAPVARYRQDFSAHRDSLLADLLRPHRDQRPATAAEVRRRWQGPDPKS
jgi:serine/threonine protein kinase